MGHIQITKWRFLALALALAAVVIATMGCTFGLAGASVGESGVTGTPEATATPQVAVIGVIDKIEGDQVTVSGQVYILPASAIAELEAGDKLIILVRVEGQAECGGENNSEGGDDEGD